MPSDDKAYGGVGSPSRVEEYSRVASAFLYWHYCFSGLHAFLFAGGRLSLRLQAFLTAQSFLEVVLQQKLLHSNYIPQPPAAAQHKKGSLPLAFYFVCGLPPPSGCKQNGRQAEGEDHKTDNYAFTTRCRGLPTRYFPALPVHCAGPGAFTFSCAGKHGGEIVGQQWVLRPTKEA